MAQKTTSRQIIKILRKELPYLKEHFKVSSLSLFGSYAKDKQTPESDVDIIVIFNEPPGFFGFIKLENYLSNKLGCMVDLVMKDALKPNIGNRVKEEVIAV
jgi:predicted nucleotidyltransferase